MYAELNETQGGDVLTDTKALKERIKASGLKQDFIAKKLGITSFGFAKKRDNVNQFKASEIDMLCDLLNIDSLEDRFAIFFAKDDELN